MLFTRFETADDIPSSYFTLNKKIRAVVVSVTDGDTVRVRHVNTWHRSNLYAGKLSEHTIAVRFAAVDAPETGKFGKKGQPLGLVSKEFVEQRLLGRQVTIKLLSRDQFRRAVGLVSYYDNVMLPNFMCHKKDISEQLLLAGMAVVYRQGGAKYDGLRDRWDKLENVAIDKKLGIWEHETVELPSEYKRKYTLEKDTEYNLTLKNPATCI